MRERWKDIPYYEGYYQVSNQGRIRTLGRIGQSGRKSPARIMNPTIDCGGYWRVCFTKDRIEKKKFVHVLHAEAFLPNPYRLPFVNHKNSIRSDNRLSNYEWVTMRENVSHGATKIKNKASKFIGVCKDGPKTPNHKKIWRAQIWLMDKQVKLGYFYTEQEASDAYQKALVENSIVNRYLKIA